MTTEARKDIKFYITLILGFSLLVMGFFAEPPGDINSSIIIASGILFSIGSMAVGIDIKGTIEAIIKLKQIESKTDEANNK